MPDRSLDAQPPRAELVRRLHCAEGHLRGIAAMVEGGADCESVIRQTRAVRAALREVDRLMIRQHLQNCLRSLADEATEQMLDEVVRLYQLTRAWP